MAYKPERAKRVDAYMLDVEREELDRHAKRLRLSRAQLVSLVMLEYLKENRAELERYEAAHAA